MSGRTVTGAAPVVGPTAAPSAVSAHRPGRLHRSSGLAYLMIAPMLILLLIFVLIPFVQAAYLSLFDFSFYRDSIFLGLDNYTFVLTDPQFTSSLGRGVFFATMVVPTGLVLAFVFASVVRGLGRRLSSVIKTSIYIPTIISGVITSILFLLIYDYYGGILNAIIGAVATPIRTAMGLGPFEPIGWLAEPSLALPALAVPAVWMGFGITALIMLAGMLDIPESYYESASLDGANWWQQMIHITLPQLKNVLVFLMISGAVASIQQLELPLIMTGGGPLGSTVMPNFYIFQNFTQSDQQGRPIAAALVLFVLLAGISALVFRFVNSEKAQDG